MRTAAKLQLHHQNPTTLHRTHLLSRLMVTSNLSGPMIARMSCPNSARNRRATSYPLFWKTQYPCTILLHASHFTKLTENRSFSQKPERIRQHSNILPTALFRTHYETSTTLSRNVDEHTHPKHRANIRLKLGDKNSFRSIGNFAMSKDVTRERIERHLVWNKKIDPSSFISAFNHISKIPQGTALLQN
jgi:hypothetical protein